MFVLSAVGKEQVLHSFAEFSDGAVPFAGVIMDSAGNLYGDTSNAGDYGSGTVFRIKP